ncbi:phosphatase PAP2 family protein [uncultured Cellulomonas sp.]|uniref:phosphatase PAP2 family protein n=1 Tax=uncultured Cellulomonas sp. TaxID=189682 RepID=UPI00262A7858|nr:phosphatase PAP2 family protein [uncultured Cellulomonas sp.]
MREVDVERASWRALFGVALTVSLVFGAMTLVVAVVDGLPLRDPDGFLGPSYVRLPLIVAAMIALDVVPRVLARRPAPRDAPAVLRDVVRTRWHPSRLAVVAAGLATFYVAYVAYRNLKSFLPFLRQHLTDASLVASDRLLAFGHHPGNVLHEVLGTGVAADVLSWVYLFFLTFVPFSLAAALVWSSDLARGAWYATALSFNWILGTATYYVLPSLGPIYVERFRFADLPSTGVSDLQNALWNNRLEVLAGPHATQSVHGIAAFASLHVSIVVTAALVAHLVRLPWPVRWALWLFVLLTVLATVYFGWHYLVDVLAGVAVGWLAVRLAAMAVGRGSGEDPRVSGELRGLGAVEERAVGR